MCNPFHALRSFSIVIYASFALSNIVSLQEPTDEIKEQPLPPRFVTKKSKLSLNYDKLNVIYHMKTYISIDTGENPMCHIFL